MLNPLRSEAEAFRFLVGAIVYFALIAIAAVFGGRWVGVAVFAVLTVALFVVWLRARRAEPTARARPTHDWPASERRILVVANETVGGAGLRKAIRNEAEGGRARVFVVSPALNSPVRHWTSDEDDARARAQERLDASLARLRETGLEVDGEVGDGDPLQAIEDALRSFGADQIVISTHPEGRSHWLERGVVSAARKRFVVPITHVVVDLDAEREEIR